MAENQEVSAAEFQAEMRAKMAELQSSVHAGRAPARSAPSTAQSPEELLAARMEEVADYPFYCPGCGALYKYERECTGKLGSAPHPPIDVVSTDELHSEDATDHTAAPVTTT